MLNSVTEWSLPSLFLLGFMGSGHCIGMCGPLVLAIPGRQPSRWAHGAYHAGRIITYTIIGGLLGGVGQGVRILAGADASLQWIARAQILLSLFAAVFLLLFGLSRLGILPEPALLSKAQPDRIPGFKHIRRRFFSAPGLLSTFSFGLMLGFLPCGLSYAAFAAALPSGSIINGALGVFVFGLGTLPALLLVGLGGASLARRYRRLSDLLAGMLMIGMAVSLGITAIQAVLG